MHRSSRGLDAGLPRPQQAPHGVVDLAGQPTLEGGPMTVLGRSGQHLDPRLRLKTTNELRRATDIGPREVDLTGHTPGPVRWPPQVRRLPLGCLLYTSDAADEEDSVDLGGRR